MAEQAAGDAQLLEPNRPLLTSLRIAAVDAYAIISALLDRFQSMPNSILHVREADCDPSHPQQQVLYSKVQYMQNIMNMYRDRLQSGEVFDGKRVEIIAQPQSSQLQRTSITRNVM